MIKPLYDNVVIVKEKEVNETKSGIVLASKETETSYARVVAVGEGSYIDGKLVPVPVKVGDKVLYKKYSTTEVKLDGEDYLLVGSKDILAVVE